MNPDTKLTLEQLQLICRRHNIPYQSHSRITSGFSHEVHRLNDDLVIKLFNTDSSRHFDTEAAMLASNANFPKPKLIASNGPTEEIDRSYVIMTYVQGASLGSKWHIATELQRENLIKEISQVLRTINQINPSEIALEAEDSWEASVLRGGVRNESLDLETKILLMNLQKKKLWKRSQEALLHLPIVSCILSTGTFISIILS